MYQLMHVSLISKLILALLFGSVPAVAHPSSSSGDLLQQNTGTIVIVKDTVPDASRDFSFQIRAGQQFIFGAILDDDPNSNNFQNQFSRDVEPGTYTVEEFPGGGWAPTAITCDDTDSQGNVSTRTATVVVEAGETVTCTFRNELPPGTERGTIVVTKDSVPNDPEDFTFRLFQQESFTLDDDEASATPNTFSITVEAGTHVLEEDNPGAGWDLTAITCDDAQTAINLGSRRATIQLQGGETVTCTFTNESVATGTIVMRKDSVPDDPQNFTFQISGPNGAAGGQVVDDDPGSTNPPNEFRISVEIGAYTLAENAVSGWTLTGISCDDPESTSNLQNRSASVDVDADETVTCTFTNTKDNVDTGRIVIRKDAIPDDPQDFSFNYPAFTGSFILDDDLTSTVPQESSFDVAVGTYTVAEAAPPSDWTLTGLTCDDPDGGTTTNVGARTATIDVDANQTITCTFTNTKEDQPPPTATSTPTATTTPTPTNTPTPTDTSTSTGTVVIVKDAQPNDPQDFRFTGGDLQVAPFFLDDDNDPTLSNQITFINVDPGTYFVTEDQDPPGWDLTNITCDDDDSVPLLANREVAIVLDAGETVTCTFTNTNVGGTVIIVKDAVPNDAQDFRFTGGDLQVAPFFLDDDDDPTLPDQITFTNVDPGTYFVTEDQDPPGWDLTGIACDDNDSVPLPANREVAIVVSANETVTCTFTNTQEGQPPTDTPTATATPVPTDTATPTDTSTSTVSPTVTATPSRTPTPTMTSTPTKIPAKTHTPTRTPTPTKTATNIPTNTPTNIPSGPTCEGFAATIYVNSQGRIVGGPNNGQTYQGTLNGTNGADVIVGTTSSEDINGNGGNDRICSGGGSDDVEGGDGDDRMFGGNGNDELEGGTGNDRISGQEGSDEMYGEDGSDLLTGGPSADVFNGGPGTDTATDFSSSQGDTKTSVENT